MAPPHIYTNPERGSALGSRFHAHITARRRKTSDREGHEETGINAGAAFTR